ncbi:class I SAM-dependent methyltransferase [uncultured Thermanaerothrix sp.]|uniref:class I SAM-dependent methyltransferase n=1 Tax=uncultured Thermanaerothrix sp. TaxID=1195149 RepID=UPI00260BBC07|nr:class I SAM-dependent methyltransferase [uncultured Thermanaerothrix sp.]
MGELLTPANLLSDKDFERSYTAHHIGSLLSVLRPLKNRLSSPGRLLDIGCGFGGIALTIKSFLGLAEAHGVDIDESAVKEAGRRGVVVYKLDAAREKLPYPDGFF